VSKRSLNLNRAVSCHTANQGLVGWWLGLPGCLDKTSLRDITPFRNPAILDPPNSGYKSSVVLDGTNTRFYSLLNTAGPYNYAGATAQILNILPLSLNGPLSVSAWFRNTAATSGHTGQFLSLCKSSNNWGLGLGYNRIVTTRYGAILNTSPCGASPGTYHYLYTQDGANHNKLFINGVLYASATGAGDAANLDTIQIIKGVGNAGSSVGDYVGDVRVLNWDASNQAGVLYRQRLKGYPDLLAYRSFVSFAKASSGGTGVTGTAATTAGTTTTSTATVAITGTAATTAGTPSIGTGTVKISGTAATTAGTTASGTGTVTITGTASTSAGTVTAGTGATVVGAAAVTTASTTTAGTGTVRITGSGSVTAGSIAAGTAAVLVTGNGAITASSVVSGTGTTTGSSTGAAALIAGSTVAGTGTVGIAGAGAITAGSTVAGSGSIQVTGSGSITAGSVASGTGTTGNVATGAGSITAGSVASGTGTVLVTGSGTITAGSVSGGTAAIKITGTGAITAGSVVSGTGTNGSALVDTNVYVFYIGV
jgi:hypothetical protein